MSPNTEAANSPGRLPKWLRKRFSPTAKAAEVSDLLVDLGLSTVCCGAQCPNQPECFAKGTATFLILGDTCTRSCRFCAIGSGEVGPLREDEPEALAEAWRGWGCVTS